MEGRLEEQSGLIVMNEGKQQQQLGGFVTVVVCLHERYFYLLCLWTVGEKQPHISVLGI